MTLRKTVLVCTFAAAVAGGCGNMPPDDVEAESVAHQAQAVWFDSQLLTRPHFIPVCFEPDSAYSPSDRQVIQDALAASWHAAADVTFTGFGDCGPWHITFTPNQEVRLRTGPVPPGFGGVTNNRDYRDKSDQDTPFWTPTTVDLLVPVAVPTILHEFGHVLGFAHEQTTDELPPANPCIQRTSGGRQLSANDLSNSIMSYCSNATWLSEQDEIGARRVYGPFPEFAPNQSLPDLYPQDGLVFDSASTRGYTGDGNWDITVEPHDTLPPPRHYDLGYTRITFGAECGLHDVVDGISVRAKVDSSVLSLPHSIKCKNGDSRIGFPTPGTGAESTIHYLSKTTSSGAPIDDRGWPSVGWDWDFGFVKAECIFGQVVTGVGQTEDDEIDAIACAPSGYFNTNNCQTIVVPPFGNPGYVPPDWAYGYVKTQCGFGEYMKGVSKDPNTGEVHAILCCSWDDGP